MTAETLYLVFGDINEHYVQAARSVEAVPKKARWIRWAAAAACLGLLACAGLLFRLSAPAAAVSEFTAKVNCGELTKTTIAMQRSTLVPVGGRTARYNQVGADESMLAGYVGREFTRADGMTLFYPADTHNLKYLIGRTADGRLSLWEFSSFLLEEDGPHTYGDILRIIYGVDGADDIVNLTTSPSRSNNTDLGRSIQQEVGTRSFSREEIEAFYGVAESVACYGFTRDDSYRLLADDQRFTYSFSTDDPDKLTSGEETYGTRCISLVFADGTVLDSWKYSALSGSFYEYGGIYTEPLAEADVSVLNGLFGIA